MGIGAVGKTILADEARASAPAFAGCFPPATSSQPNGSRGPLGRPSRASVRDNSGSQHLQPGFVGLEL